MKKWSDIRKELCTQEEIREIDEEVAIIGELIKERGEGKISQQEYEDMIKTGKTFIVAAVG